MKRILWVDDEIELLKPHIILLEQRGYEVETATNGEDAIELGKTQSFDLIFLDEMMVGMSGLETLDILKDINASVPVVMVTTEYDPQKLADVYQLGVSAICNKSFDPELVRNIVQRLFK